MISVPATTTAPIGGRGDFDGPNAPHGEETPAGATAPADAPAQGGDALAKFGAENGLHADVQQLVHEPAHGADESVRREQAQNLMTEGTKLLLEHKY